MLKKTQNWRKWFSSLMVGSVLITSSQEGVYAQIIPDTTLPNNSDITRDGNTFNIDGGTEAGSNLFHSFEEFSVPTNGTASFNNAVNIQNIIGRVTGGKASNIDGLIKANGSANLFFINPWGIVFGENARLDIGGSFLATTADAIGFGKDNFFSAANPQNSSSLLEVAPDALFFNRIKTASIENNSVADAGFNPIGNTIRGLRVADGKSLLLVGGNVTMDGGGALYTSGENSEVVELNGGVLSRTTSYTLIDVPGGLYAFGGRIELGGLNGKGTIGLNGNGNNLSLSFPSGVQRSNVSISNDARVEAISDDGGSIAINAKNLEMTGGSWLLSGIWEGLGSEQSKSGNIDINTTAAINLKDESRIANQAQIGNGQGGDINISTGTLQLEDGSVLETTTFSRDNGGNLTIKADTVLLEDDSLLGTATFLGSGNGGNLTINTNTLLVDGSQVNTSSFLSKGNGGNLTIQTDTLQLNNALVITNTFGEGNGGNLTIKTNSLLVDGSQVNTGTFDKGNGGNLTVEAQDVQLIGRSENVEFFNSFTASTEEGSTGDAGDLTIKTNTLLIDGAIVGVRSRGTGIAGEMTLNADSIRLKNEALLTADTQSNRVAPTEQATININSQDLIMTGNSNILTNATGKEVVGGNINIDTDLLIGFENSDISANSDNFFGGRVRIDTRGILGIQPTDVASPSTSDITATGADPSFSGTVELDSPEVDPDSGLVELPTIPVDTEVAQGCYSPGVAQSSFVITGRGGLPPNPKDILTADATKIDWVSVKPSNNNRYLPQNITKANTQPSKPIVEATGAILNAKGQIVLTANPSAVTSRISKYQPISCQNN